jgi:hypothetical protein
MDTLMNMPIADRKFYIMLHNKTEGNGDDGSSEMNMEEVDKINMMRQVKEWH